MIDLKKIIIDAKYFFKRGPVSERRLWRKAAREALFEKRMKSTRWGVSYSVFDGEELLEYSLRSIRDEVDYINVVYQLISWYGKPASPDLLPLLRSLQKNGLIDELIEFTPDISVRAKENERNKRNIGLTRARLNKCRYFMSMDCDEFYVGSQISESKKNIVKHGLTHSYCIYVPYGFSPVQRPRDWPKGDVGFVPFFARLYPWSRLKITRGHICTTDPTRCLAAGPFSRQKVLTMVTMHHLSLVRKDLAGKFDNSSSRHKLEPQLTPASVYDEANYYTVENQFNIDLSQFKLNVLK